MSTRKSFDSEASQQIGLRIKEIRGKRTQAEFAELLGVDRATLSNYESGRRQPNSEVLKKIAGLGGTTVPRVIFGETKTKFDSYIQSINESVARLASENPGFIPRWYISQDEIDLIFALRRMYDDDARLEIINHIIERADASIQRDRDIDNGKIPPYGEANVARLKKILETGNFEEGYDPDVYLWATFHEETMK